MTRAALILSPEALRLAYAEPVLTRLRRRARIEPIVAPGHDWVRHRAALAEIEVMFSGWGAPVIDHALLEAMPALKAIFYAGGSVRYFATHALWQRGVRLTTGVTINAIPVAEFCVSAILLGLKRFWHYARLTREERTFRMDRPLPGAYHSHVGLVSYGVIGRLVRENLRAHEVNVLVYDPYLSDEEARAEKVTKVALDDLFARSDVVSVHTPLLAETVGLISRRHLERMKSQALFINTARGEIVDEAGLVAALGRRTDLHALIDVTSPEPPVATSPLYDLPNVTLTPHLAGSLGPECQRLGHAMADEFERYLEGRPLRWELTPERAATMA